MRNNELSTGKALMGAILSPIMAIVFSQNGVNICTGIFVLATIAFWIVLALRLEPRWYSAYETSTTPEPLLVA